MFVHAVLMCWSNRGVHCSHDSPVGRLIGGRSECGQPIERNHVVWLDGSGFTIFAMCSKSWVWVGKFLSESAWICIFLSSWSMYPVNMFTFMMLAT